MKHRPNAPRQNAPRTPARAEGETIAGLRAGLAVFARRPADILRVGYGRAARGEVEALVRWASARNVPCGEVADGELARIAGGEPHEGLCVLVRERRGASAQDVGDALVKKSGTAVALDRVRNPYNVGAIL